MSFDLSSLPDFPSLQQLARALWRNGSLRGAAILVGAGFSKNAELTGSDTPAPPLWSDLLEGLKAQLYPPAGEGAPTNPLRLAEEYRTYLGQAALDDFIRMRFPDRAWQPGRLHEQLLNLPWSDVLTTNWDTLLERAAQQVSDYTYEFVRFETDLPHARSPRIVKLHGTLGDTAPLIFAEEDYRTYPAKHAAYVNLARQIFIENELCLIGFSGEDPNFLQWAGWVRDQLGGTARRIYLVGCLNLPKATRKFLEAHNIAPIDFAPAVAGLPKADQHAKASELFFETMLAAKPSPRHEWPLLSPHEFPLIKAGADAHEHARKNDEFAAEMLAKTCAFAKVDRESYPGWLICPSRYRRRLAHGMSEVWLVRETVLSRFKIGERCQILGELVWRQTTGLLPLRANLGNALIAFLGEEESKAFGSERLSFALALMRNARLTCNDEALESWGSLIDTEASPDSSYRGEAQYQRCLRARDILDLDGLAASLEKLNSDDPIWKMRRAALYCELGEDSRADKLIRESATELDRRHRLDRASLWIKSRLAWANWLSRSAEGFRRLRLQEPRNELYAREFRELLIDPAEEIELIQDAADRKLAKSREEDAEVTPLFEAGHYRLGSAKNRPSHPEFDVDDRYELDLLIETVGLPLTINHVGICNSAAISVALVTVEHRLEWFVWLLRAFHSHYDKPFIRHFSRIAVAQIPSDLSAILLSIVDKAVGYWVERLKRATNADLRDDMGRATDALRLFLTVQSRLTVRMTEADAKSVYLIALDRAKDPLLKHPWLCEALGDQIKYSAQAISRYAQGELAFAAIDFPLSTEIGIEERIWPNGVMAIWESTPTRPAGDIRWAHRVQQLISASSRGLPSRKEATYRLAYLAIRGGLLYEESRRFAETLWSELDAPEYGLPANTNLIPSAFAQLPAPVDSGTLKRLEQRLLGAYGNGQIVHTDPQGNIAVEGTIDRLMSLANAERIGLKITSSQAVLLFDRLITTSIPMPGTRTSFGDYFSSQLLDNVRVLIGEVLSRVVVPAIPHDQRTSQQGEALLAFAQQTGSWSSLVALPHFLSISTSLTTDIETAIRRGLVSFDFQHASGASLALACWAKLAKRKVVKTVPRALIEQLIAAIETRQERGLQVRLQVAGNLHELGFLKPPIVSRLIQALGDLRDETRYQQVASDSHAAVTVSLVRSQCVTLAKILLSHGYDEPTLQAWIEDAANDALPEVRFSVGSD